MAKVSLRAYNREIEAMIDRGHLDEAVAHCQHILKIFPKHLETYRLLGKAYLEAKRHNEAADIFSRVLVAEPNDFVSQVGMSIIRDEQGKLDDAIWHMERAFEVQSANPAIQSELQRLYGRRDGVQPPRIRMTRGALAHMYMRGELYPQAISESKNVLQEDQGRSDMQALLAKAFYKSGQKNDAADAASAVLKRYPYCLDANRVLTEVLGSDRPESAQVYRQRVVELDPYAAQVNGTVFQASEVGDAAVTLDHLDWNGQPVGTSPDWGAMAAIALASGALARDEQPDWLKNAPPPETPSTPPSAPMFATQQKNVFSSPSADSPAQPADEIPDFLRAAGWSESTGAFDESQASSTMFDDEPASPAEPIVQGDLPDWVKAMAPAQASQSEEREEEIPDWINKIGTDALPVPSENSAPGDDNEDWLKQLGDVSPSQPQDSTDQPDWIKEQQSMPVSDDQPDWLRGIGEEQPPSGVDDQLDWLNQPAAEAELQTSVSAMDTGELGKSEEERDDSFAWLENLAAKQGATEGLLTKPEERLEDEPDWIKQAKGLSESVAVPPVQQQPQPTPPANVEDLGKSSDEIDDALAWFESLAVKQGATEGLLTKPEDRLEQEPDWVKQAKNAPIQQPSVSQEPEAAPADDVSSWLKGLDDEEETQQPAPVAEDDTASWLKSLDEPEETPIATGDLPAWMQDSGQEQVPSTESVVPANEAEATDWMSEIEEPATEAPVPVQEVASEDLPGWLSGLDEEESKASSVSDDLPAWMRDETGEVVAEPTKIEPTRPADWKPMDEKEDEAIQPPPPAPSTIFAQDKSEPKKKSASRKTEVKPATPPEPYIEPVTRRMTGMLTMPVDPTLGSARNELSRSNIPGALEAYEKLIKKGRFLEEVIYDLREALYRYPVEVSIWQTLGDAYMRANQLQDALDAYTKAEELLR